MASQLTNLIVPSVFTPYMLDQSIEKNVFVKSGIIQVDEMVGQKLAGGGSVFTLPSFINPDLAQTAANVPTGDSAVKSTAEALTGHAQKIVRLARNKSYNSNNLVRMLTGADPTAAIGAFAGDVLNQWRQFSLVNQVEGVLGTALSANVHNIASESIAGKSASTELTASNATALITSALIGAWGDRGVDQTVLVMHSDVYAVLMAGNTTPYLQPAFQVPGFKSYNGYPVLVDDRVGKRAGTTDGFVYTVYAVKADGIVMGYTPDVRAVEVFPAPDQGNGAGGENIYFRDVYAYHIIGTSFTGSAAGDIATDAELATANKWSLVRPSKSVGVAALRFNLA